MNKEKIIKKWGYKAITQQYQKLIDKLLLQDLDQLINKVCKWTEDEDYGSTYILNVVKCGVLQKMELWKIKYIIVFIVVHK